ncbi:MAG TPA: hypothetical protein VFT59_01025 [Candidatus Saccharimonadales bacterium]|nr:hypothetical protein [Candidatus Saccharimonadales bacterium]
MIGAIVGATAPRPSAYLIAAYQTDTTDELIVEFSRPDIDDCTEHDVKMLARALEYAIKASFSAATRLSVNQFNFRV